MPMMLVILDGAGDDPALGGLAPAGDAARPNLRRMAVEGARGRLLTAPEGLPVDSLTCIGTLLGVPPERIPAGRAYLEALAAGVAVGEADAVCRCNLVEVGPDGRVLGNLPAAPPGRAADGLRLYHLGSYKNLLLCPGMAGQIPGSVTFPPHEHFGEPLESLLPAGTPLAGRLRRFALGRSRPLPGGRRAVPLPWDLSARRELPSFHALHGARGAAVCAAEIVRGLALAMGLEPATPPGATGDGDTDLEAKARAALGLLGRFPFVLVHLNGADELAHRRDAAGKAAFLARADRELLGPLLRGAPAGARILVTSDHATLCASGRHRGGPQPFVLWGGPERGELGEHGGARAVPLLKGMV